MTRGIRILPPPGERLLPLASALLLVLSFPPVDLLLPPFVALVPVIVFLAELPPGADGRQSALRAGYFLGVVYFGLLLYWMVAALTYYSFLAVPAYILTVLILAGFTAAFAGAVHLVLERTPVPLALAAAVLWTATEWVQGNLHDLSFPWLGLGTALSAFPRVAGAADLVGARGLTFWLALVNGLVATGVVAWRAALRPVGIRLVAVTALVVALPVGYGFWRAQTLELRPAARVAVVQPNIPEELKLDPAVALDTSRTALRNLTLAIEPGSVDLVVWPEVALPDVLGHPSRARLEEWVRELSAEVDAPILVGAYGYEEAAGRYTFYNSAFLVDAAAGRRARYHKQHLVPFVERVPFVDPARVERIVGELKYFGGLGRGAGEPVFRKAVVSERDRRVPAPALLTGSPGPGAAAAREAAAGREVAAAREAPAGHRAQAGFGVLICYESIFAPLSRRFRRAGADYLLNITNDAWFGRETGASRTSALWQHPAHLPMRAIEGRVGIARAANTGISMFVDPLGRTYQETELFVPDVRVATVLTTDGLTLYARWGDWLGTAAALAALLMLLAAFDPRARPRRGAGPAVLPRREAPRQ